MWGGEGVRRRAAAAGVAVAMVACAYALGSVLGRPDALTKPMLHEAPTAPVGTAAATGPDPLPPEQADEEDSHHAVAAPHQVAGAGNLPLANIGGGPFGSHRTTGGSYVALTFDDGPDPRYTPQVLELLRSHQVRATFCVVGNAVEAYPELVRQIAADGHTLCNHSWSHDLQLGQRSPEAIRADLERTSAAIRSAVPDARISYYRQPGGYWTPAVVEVAAELGMSSLHWDVDPQDWREPGAGAIASRVVAWTQAGSIVLLHDGGGERHGTVQALATILPYLSAGLPLEALPPGVDQPPRHGRELSPRPDPR